MGSTKQNKNPRNYSCREWLELGKNILPSFPQVRGAEMINRNHERGKINESCYSESLTKTRSGKWRILDVKKQNRFRKMEIQKMKTTGGLNWRIGGGLGSPESIWWRHILRFVCFRLLSTKRGKTFDFHRHIHLELCACISPSIILHFILFCK